MCLSLSKVIEFSPASVAGLTWYYALDLPSATCLFHHQARVADTQVLSLPPSLSPSPPFLSSLSLSLCGWVGRGSESKSESESAHAQIALPASAASASAATSAASAAGAAQARLWVLIINKSTLSSTPQQRRLGGFGPGPIGTGEPFSVSLHPFFSCARACVFV